MFDPHLSRTENMDLDEVIARLKQNDVVDGILQIGSMREERLKPHSDYDLLIVLREMPLPLHVLLTIIEGRLADIIFVRSSFVQAILSEDFEQASNDYEGILLEHIKTGTIAYDREDQLSQAQQRLSNAEWFHSASERTIYTEAVRSIHYNYQQNRRYLHSSDPIYQKALEIRLLYSLMQVIFGYVTVRRIPWQGEKKAIGYWQEHDADYLSLFEAYQQAENLEERFSIYTQMAERTLQPVGGLWPRNAVNVALEGDAWSPEDVKAAIDYWHSLIF
jgi:predicted nucleotidyltransferase